MRASRQTSSTVVPSSACRRMKAICCSLNFDLRTGPANFASKREAENFLNTSGPAFRVQITSDAAAVTAVAKAKTARCFSIREMA